MSDQPDVSTRFANITLLPGMSFDDDGCGGTILDQPAIVDANNPTKLACGEYRFEPPGDDDSDDDLRLCVATFLANAIHEVQEWLRVDGRRVFNPHPDVGPLCNAMWEHVSTIAWRAAGEALDTLPRSESDDLVHD